MSYIESVSGGLTYQALTPDRRHKVEHGETLGSIARQYGVSPEAIKANNPQIVDPNRLYPGDILLIPAQNTQTETTSFPLGEGAPTVKYTSENKGPPTEDGRTTVQAATENSYSISGDGISVGRGNSTKTETVTAGTEDNEITRMRRHATNGSVNFDPNAGSVTLSAGTEFSESVKNARGWGVSFGLSSNATVTAGTKTEEGITTYQASADVSVTLKGGVSVPRAGAEFGHTEGIKTSFTVSLPEAVARHASLESVNPFDPSSMPEGTVVKLDGAHYTRNEFKITFRELAVQTKVTNESGVSIAVEKTGESTVRVTAGPTEAIKAYNGVGVDFDKVSLMLGRNDTLSSATLKTAEFDLSTRSGQAKYNDFLATGRMPSQDGVGVSDVATIEKLDYESQAKLDAKLGPVSIGFEGAKNTGNSVVTTLPDGTVSRTADLQYSGNVPLRIKQQWDANGNEAVAARQYTYTIEVGRGNEALLNVALTGDDDNFGSGPVDEGQTVEVTFTESQMHNLMYDTRAALQISDYANHRFQLLSGYDIGTRQYYTTTPFDFAIGMARNLGSSNDGIAGHLFAIADAIDGSFDGKFSESIGASLTVVE